MACQTQRLALIAAVLLFLLIFLYNKDHLQVHIAVKAISKQLLTRNLRIAIVEVIEASTDAGFYGRAIASVECYARAQNYVFELLNDSEYSDRCRQNDKFFRRHCVVAQYLRITDNIDYVLFIDSDMGVVNPKRRIEEFIDTHAEIVFYDRFYNWEVMAGSYLVKNTLWVQDFLNGYADYAYRLPNSFHGTDNGAIHAYLAEKIFPHGHPYLKVCLQLYRQSKGYDDLFMYEACIRDLLGNTTDFGVMKIIRKGYAWCRDNWLTNSKWSPERDFMIHNWKRNQLRNYSTTQIPNTTWSYDKYLITTGNEIDKRLKEFAEDVEKQRAAASSRVRAFMQQYTKTQSKRQKSLLSLADY